MENSSMIKKKQDQDEKGQKFNSEWKNKESPLYKPWIDEVIGKPTKCRCKWCSRDFKVENMYGPHGHCNSDKHIKYSEIYQKNLKEKEPKQPTDNDNKDLKNSNEFEELSFIDKTKLFEYKMIRFITYKNLPFNKIQAMCNFLKDNINDEHDIKLFKSA